MNIFTKLFNIVKTITNPQQAINKMLPNLPPEISTMLKSAIQKNANPMQILSEAASKGDITLEHFTQMKNLFITGKRFGLKQFRNIDTNQFDVIEQTIKNASSNRTVNKNGFRRL